MTIDYLRRLVGRARRLRPRLSILQHAISPRGSVARLFLRAGIATRVRALRHRIAGYRGWVALFDELTADDKEEIARCIARTSLPTINVIWVLAPADRAADVARLVRSLQEQLLAAWTLTVLVLDENDMTSIDDAVRSDPRVRVQRQRDGGTQPDLPREHLLLLFAPGVFREHSLFTFAQAAVSGAQVVYCDTDRIDHSGVRTSPAFRPDFSPTLARQVNYLGPCIYVRTSERLAGDVRSELQISRTIADSEPAAVVHLPFILFHQTVDRQADIEIREVDDSVLSVSIVIPTRDRVELLKACIDSIRVRTDYPAESIEIIVVDNGSADTSTLDYLRDLSSERNVQVIRDDGSFNYSRLNNLAAGRARGEVLVLLNNDIVIEDALWLRRLVSYAAKPDVGAVGGKLLYPDRTVQHAGVVLIGGGARHAHLYAAERASGYLSLAALDREVAAVTGACLAMRRELFSALGGLDESLAISYNDVSLCAEAQRRGYRNIAIAAPLAIHFESKSRGFDDTPGKMEIARNELTYAVSRYRDLFRNDPFYSPNLSMDGTYGLAYPPRTVVPWRRFSRGCEGKRRIVLLGEPGLGATIEAGLRAHIRALLERGHDVLVASTSGWSPQNEGCRHLILRSPDEAAEFVVREAADCVVVHSSPFFAVARWLGDAAGLVMMQHPAEAERGAPGSLVSHNRFWLAWADKVVTNDTSVDIATLIDELCADRVSSVR